MGGAEQAGSVATGDDLRGQDCQRCQARRSSDRAADDIRVGGLTRTTAREAHVNGALSEETEMRDMRRLGASVIVWLLFAPLTSSSEAQQLQFYTGHGMSRVFGCLPLDTLTINGVGTGQQGECTSYQTGLIIGAAVPIETWVAAQ